MPMNQVHDAISEACWEIRTVVRTSVLLKPPRNEHARVTLAQGQLHIGISLIVAQQNVKARLLLLDEMILKRQRLFVVGYDNVVNVDRFANKCVGFGVFKSALTKVRTDAAAQVICLANIDNLPLGVLI